MVRSWAMDPTALAEQPLGSSTTRRAILLTLLREGPLTPETLAARVDLSRTAVLHQLRVLAQAGLVDRTSLRHGVGRPRHLYDVTPRAQGLVEANYPGFARSVLDGIQRVGGPALLADVFDAIRHTQAERIRARFSAEGLDSSPLEDRARALAAFQRSQGFIAEVTNGDALRLQQRNCPFFRVIAGEPAACDIQLDLLQDVLKAEVTREASIAAGDRFCIYRIDPARA
jgi:predicted ArsR family transcriptional regulator